MRRAVVLLSVGLLVAACRFDPAYRDVLEPLGATCTEGAIACRGAKLTRCDASAITVLDDCGARGLACADVLGACSFCVPGALECEGNDVMKCADDGQTRDVAERCDGAAGIACERGACVDLCADARAKRSNVGCEYWPVDLDNVVLPDGNAAIQQFAVIVTNPHPTLAATITVEEDLSAPGTPAADPRKVLTVSLPPGQLEVIKLGPKEVDGSPPGMPNTGTGTALTRGAFRLRSTAPIIAYQFNPLENVNVRSNDATVLLPTSALAGESVRYVVAGWPQTIAQTDEPATNYGQHLRAFLTVVGTAPDTKVKITPTARVIAGGPFPQGIAKGTPIEVTLQPFDVLNLETGDFKADFTGSTVQADRAIVVYVGSEASDAPIYDVLRDRQCCADHLETQVVPVRVVGKRYAIGRMPNRSRAVSAAGAPVGLSPEPELYRVVAATEGTTHVTTTLDPPWDAFDLDGAGANVIIDALRDFRLEASAPVLVADVQVGQQAAGIRIESGLPGGDPSLLLVPPIEQWRSEYVVLTPDKYAFDFLVVTAPNGVSVFVDGLPAGPGLCDVNADATTGFTVYRCQLSFPILDPARQPPDNVQPGEQNDGVHRVVADAPVSVLVYGFDYRVSYAYAGGTELVDINPD
ncbi:MAG: IgGFc-binding protein [Labilithrix sp.]|nr:IgGFc-binding protein [Labilithrix sp.]MCW5814096.1 IgGFc-binding protein [Labilithrix sp.]